MPPSLVTTKLMIPPRSADWVIRQRLLSQLDKGARGRLTLVSAPPGFGKTTLLASWLHTAAGGPNPRRAAWLSLDEQDNSPGRFLRYLIASLQAIEPNIGLAAKSLAESQGSVDLEQAVALLINDLTGLAESSVLVVDDFHVITRPELQSAVAYFVERLPPSLHLAIATRHEPALPLPRLRARNEVTEIRLQDLRLTENEAAEFLDRTMAVSLPADARHALEERADGWVAGLQMAAISLRGHGEATDRDFTARLFDAVRGDQRDIIDYLATEVLKQQPPEIRDFLRKTAILDRFNADLCDAVTGTKNSGRLLAQLEKANLFLIPLDDRRQWFRFHHLFADFLRTESTDAKHKELHRKASRWFDSQQMTDDAIRHALAGADFEAAARLISRGVDERIPHGEFNTILDWINSLPEKVLRSHIDLLVQKGWILYMRGDPVTGAAYAALAVENQREDDSPTHKGTLLSFRADLAMHQGNAPQAVKLGKQALKLFGEEQSFHRTIALSHLGQAQRLCGDRLTAMETLRKAISLGRQLGHHESTLESVGWLARLLHQQGRLREAIQLCEEAVREHHDARGNPLPMSALVYVPLGLLCYETNDLAKARRYLLTSMALWEQMKFFPASLAQRTLAKLQFAEGDIEGAMETLAAGRALAVKSENQHRIRLASAVTAELQLRQGLVAAAAVTIDELPPQAAERTEYENLVVGRFLMTQGDFAEARKLLQHVEAPAQKEGRIGSLISIGVWQAILRNLLKQQGAAFEHLDRAIALAAQEGYRRVFLDAEPLVKELLQERQAVAPQFVASLLQGAASQATSPTRSVPGDSSKTSPIPSPLTNAQTTVLRLIADGLSNREIAARLAITPATVKAHLTQIYGKLNVASRTQAIALARKWGLL